MIKERISGLGWFAISAVSSLILTTEVKAAELVATRITETNAATYVQGGPDAAGGVGDWVLSNGSVCAIISDVSHESELSTRGGVLIDLGFCGRGDDHYVGAQDLIDSSRETPVNIDGVDAKVGSASAVVRTFGGHGGVVVETSYRLDADNPHTLFITKRLTQRADEPSVALYTSIFFNYHSLVPFVASTREPSRSNGFVQESFVSRGPAEIATFARTADLIVALSPADADAPIAYGWQMLSAVRHQADGETVELPFYALADFSALSFLAVTEPFLTGDGAEIGLLQLLEVPFTDLAPGDEIVFEEVLMIAPRADVAGITDIHYAKSPLVSGHVLGGSAVVHIDLEDGTPFTQILTDEGGRFSLHLPAGSYVARGVADAERVGTLNFTVDRESVTLAALDLGVPSRVALPRGQAMRLVFKGVDGTLDPVFDDDLLGAREISDHGIYEKTGVNQVFLMGVNDDPVALNIAPGSYKVYATRGPEFSLENTQLMVEAGNDAVLEIAAPSRLVETSGWISADFHVHSGPSFDTVLSPAKRVASFVAEGAEVLVSTEHETVFDFHPLIKALGVADSVATVTGTEITSEVQSDRTPYTLGHGNAFPVELKPHAFRRGAFSNENRRWREVIADLKAGDPTALMQLNHAREDDRFRPGAEAWDEDWSGERQAYFDHMGVGRAFNAGLPLSDRHNARLVEPDPVTGVRDIDFDAMEILNGPMRSFQPALRRDWLALISQGHRLTGTANSDSHTLGEQVGLPRNMVAVSDDALSSFSEPGFIDAVREGRLFGTTGPMLNVTLNDAQLGDTFRDQAGVLRVAVDAAPWIDVETLQISVNGTVVEEVSIGAGDVYEKEMQFETDSFVIVEVSGKAGADYEMIYPGFHPYAFTNPIYVDANKDGQWEAPGLPQMAAE
ncbi:MAG: CehA/McbA family metallohydrolase [Parvibaculum sp.]